MLNYSTQGVKTQPFFLCFCQLWRLIAPQDFILRKN